MIKQWLKEKLFATTRCILMYPLRRKLKHILTGNLICVEKVNFIRLNDRKEVCTIDSLLTIDNDYVICYTIADSYAAYYFYKNDKLVFGIYSDKHKTEFNLIENWKTSKLVI